MELAVTWKLKNLPNNYMTIFMYDEEIQATPPSETW